MQVELINSEEIKKIFYNWSQTSAICYNSDANNQDKIGKNCMYSGHFSGSRGDFFKFLITDIPRFTVDQAVRQSCGTFCNVASFRYIDKNHFCYEIPVEIADNEHLKLLYTRHMEETVFLYEKIQKYVLEKTGKQERANEQARYILPMSTHTSFVMGFTLEALIHFCNIRLCMRAEDTIRELAKLIKREVINVLPELETRLVPNCQNLLYCPEGKKSCGAYPTKKELREKLASLKNN